MVKGIARQVIVMQSPDPELFEQAIFILKDTAVKKGVTEEALLKQAKKLTGSGRYVNEERPKGREIIWAGVGAAFTGLVWILFALI